MPSKHEVNALENEHRLVISLESYKNNASQAGEICAFLVLVPRWGERAGVGCRAMSPAARRLVGAPTSSARCWATLSTVPTMPSARGRGHCGLEL